MNGFECNASGSLPPGCRMSEMDKNDAKQEHCRQNDENKEPGSLPGLFYFIVLSCLPSVFPLNDLFLYLFRSLVFCFALYLFPSRSVTLSLFVLLLFSLSFISLLPSLPPSIFISSLLYVFLSALLYTCMRLFWCLSLSIIFLFLFLLCFFQYLFLEALLPSHSHYLLFLAQLMYWTALFVDLFSSLGFAFWTDLCSLTSLPKAEPQNYFTACAYTPVEGFSRIWR